MGEGKAGRPLGGSGAGLGREEEQELAGRSRGREGTEEHGEGSAIVRSRREEQGPSSWELSGAQMLVQRVGGAESGRTRGGTGERGPGRRRPEDGRKLSYNGPEPSQRLRKGLKGLLIPPSNPSPAPQHQPGVPQLASMQTPATTGLKSSSPQDCLHFRCQDSSQAKPSHDPLGIGWARRNGKAHGRAGHL